MNVGQLLRSLLNEAQPRDPQKLELKVGQIVKGLVLQLLSEQDALVNIGGVHVKAHLETPLRQGEVAMLQVQPESADGQITLRPVANSTVLIADESLIDVLRNMGLKDTAANRQIIQTMYQESISLTKETMQAFARVMADVPSQAQADEWLQSALLAVKNNLPVTVESIAALRQVVYGTPINQQLTEFAQQLDAALTNPALAKAVTAAINQVKSLLNELHATSALAFQSPVDEAETAGKDLKSTNGLFTNQAHTAKSVLNINAMISTEIEGSATHKTVESGQLIKQSDTQGGVNSNLTLVSSSDAKEISQPSNKTSNLVPVEPRAASPDINGTELNKVQSSKESAPQWISHWLKSLGIEHEQQLFKALDKAPGFEKQVYMDQSLTFESEFTIEGNRTPGETAKQLVTDTLKAALLQLNAMDDTPQALKESTQQLLQQITGQQLLLSPDRASLFSHITLMIPMINEQGEQTAAVHIQSRKGSRGEIDANNCRLVFDLKMKIIGDTLIDVQVYNKIVSVHVHNNHDFVAQLLEGSRDEITAGLQNVGYQFLSLKISPFPEESSESDAITKESTRSPNASAYATKPYKGVDLRA